MKTQPRKWIFPYYNISFLTIHNFSLDNFFLSALSRLLTSLQQATELPSTEEELGFLSDLLQSKELHALVNAHNKIITNGSSDKFCPILSTSMHVLLDVLDVLATRTHMSEDCKELFYLLQKPHIQVIFV